MALKGSGRGKLAEFVANHVLRDIHRNMLAAVMDRDGVAYESGKITDALLQVFTIFFSPAAFIS